MSTGRAQLIRTLKYYTFGIVNNFVTKAKNPCWKDKGPSSLGNWLVPGYATDELIDKSFTAEVVKSGTIKILINNTSGWILFENLQPKKTITSHFETPVTSNETISNVATSKFRNETGDSTTRELTFTESNSTSSSNDVGASLTVAIGQSISYGGDLYGVKGETTINASATAAFNHSWGSSTDKSETRKINVNVAPRSISNVTFQKKTADFTQKATFFCAFDATVTIYCGNGHTKVKFDTIEDLITLMQGFGNPADKNNGWFVKNFALTADEYAPLLKDLQDNFLSKACSYIQTIKFSGSSSGDVLLKETDLNGRDFKYNA